MNTFNNIYFLGIGGIGMSALARYYLNVKMSVAGYDKVSTQLTNQLVNEGAEISFDDSIENLPTWVNNHETLVVFTPAIPKNSNLFNYFKNNAFTLKKRAEVLGDLTQNYKLLAVAGTHGKTTTSSMLAHILRASGVPICAFLGGISKNYNSNFWVEPDATYCVVEADEFDKSFHTLKPEIAVITSTDADHLDIYNSADALLNAYQEFANKITDNGLLITNNNVKFNDLTVRKHQKYALTEKADYYVVNYSFSEGSIVFDLQTPKGLVKNLKLQGAALHNLENAVAAIAIVLNCGIEPEKIASALSSYLGVNRRFNVLLNTANQVVIDDYAHHPKELNVLINSVKKLYVDRKITLVFQPHLFSRTKDFFNEFAAELSKVDCLWLLDIYPARELPIEGVNSSALLEKVTINNKQLIQRQDLLTLIKNKKPELLVFAGAGDIGDLPNQIVNKLLNSNNKLDKIISID